MAKVIWQYGLLYGALLVLGFLLSYLVIGDAPENYAISEAFGYSTMLFGSVAVWMGILRLRRQQQVGFLSAFLTGCGVTAVAGLCFALYTLAYLRWINPDFTAQYIAHQEAVIRASDLSQAVMDAQLQELAKYGEMMQNDNLQAMVMFFTVFAIGLIVSLVAAMTSGKTKPA